MLLPRLQTNFTMTFIDNKKNGCMVDALRRSLDGSREFSLLTSDISIFAFEAVERQLKKLKSTRLLVSRSDDAVPLAEQLIGGAQERSLRNSLKMPAIAKACSAWRRCFLKGTVVSAYSSTTTWSIRTKGAWRLRGQFSRKCLEEVR